MLGRADTLLPAVLPAVILTRIRSPCKDSPPSRTNQNCERSNSQTLEPRRCAHTLPVCYNQCETIFQVPVFCLECDRLAALAIFNGYFVGHYDYARATGERGGPPSLDGDEPQSAKSCAAREARPLRPLPTTLPSRRFGGPPRGLEEQRSPKDDLLPPPPGESRRTPSPDSN